MSYDQLYDLAIALESEIYDEEEIFEEQEEDYQNKEYFFIMTNLYNNILEMLNMKAY